MAKARILGIQLAPELGNKQANIEKIQQFVENNSWYKPDLVVIPEVFNTGIDHRLFHEQAEEIPDGETSKFLSQLAKEYNANLTGSYIEKCEDGKYKNACVFFNRQGELIAKYHKIHMFSYYGSKEGEYVSCGDSAVIVDSDIGKIGLSVCYDLRFPQLYRALAYGGAEIIVCPAAWPYPRYEHWMTLNKARAIENQVFFVSVNQAGKVGLYRTNLGQSMVINPWGEVIASAGGDEGIMMSEIDLNLVKKIREEFPVLNDRNLEAYDNLKTLNS